MTNCRLRFKAAFFACLKMHVQADICDEVRLRFITWFEAEPGMDVEVVMDADDTKAKLELAAATIEGESQ